jgi:hypothetical protein
MLTCTIPLAPCADGQSCRHFTLKDTLTATSTSDGAEDEPKVTLKDTLTATSTSDGAEDEPKVTLKDTLTATSTSDGAEDEPKVTLKDTLTATSTSDGAEDEPKVTADPNADHADSSADAGLSDVLAPSGGEYHTHGLPFFRGLVSLSFSFSSSSSPFLLCGHAFGSQGQHTSQPPTADVPHNNSLLTLSLLAGLASRKSFRRVRPPRHQPQSRAARATFVQWLPHFGMRLLLASRG